MRYLPDSEQMRSADMHTINEVGIPSLVLMERAALGTVEAMHRRGIDTSRALVVCGSGNNGGDGYLPLPGFWKMRRTGRMCFLRDGRSP